MSIKAVVSGVAPSCCFSTDLMTYLLVLFQARLCLVSCRVEEISGNTSSMVSLTPEIMILSPISGDTFRATTSQSWPARVWWVLVVLVVRWMFPLLREEVLWCKFVSWVTSSEYQQQDQSLVRQEADLLGVSDLDSVCPYLEARSIWPPPAGAPDDQSCLEGLTGQFSCS